MLAMTSCPGRSFIAAARESSRPAPWQVEPQVSHMAVSVPTSTNEYRPMSPGTSTGWPIS